MDMEMYRCFETEQKLNIWADFKNKEFSKNSFRENIKYPKSKFSLVFLPSFRTIRYSCKWNKDVLLKKKKRLKRNDLCFVIFHFRTIEVSESSHCRKHRIELQSMRASSSRVHASSIEKNISSRNELAHNRTIHSRGAYLSLPHRSLSHRSCPLRLSNDALLPVSDPYLPSDSRNLSTRNTQIPFAMNQLRLRVVEISRNTGKTCFVKKVVDVQCWSTNFQFTIFSNYTDP